MWTAKVFTLYPELFPGPLASGLYKKALEKKLWSLEVINIRDYAVDKHKTVDDPPFGGGSGMVMRADIIANALDKKVSDKNEKIIYLSPKGKKFDQFYAKKIINKNVNIICGHFEGIDQRLLETRNIEEVSVGDFILSGGEVGAFVVIDTIVRLIPGVLGHPNSLSEESLIFFASFDALRKLSIKPLFFFTKSSEKTHPYAGIFDSIPKSFNIFSTVIISL